MPCLKKMYGSLRSGVNGAKGRFGPSCSVALSVSFKNANWSKDGSPFGNTLKKKCTVICCYQIPWLFKAKLKIYNSKLNMLCKKKKRKKSAVLCWAGGGRISLYRIC